MIKIFSIALLCLFAFGSGQNTKALYGLQYRPTIGKDSLLSENYVLLSTTSQNKSLFFPYNMYKADSIFEASTKNQKTFQFSTDALPPTKLALASRKEKDEQWEYKILDGDSFQIKKENSLVWKIYPEKKQYQKWTAQKATAEFAGRKWTAWFTDEIPIPNGPYLFNSLPGMVLEIYDQGENYHFSLFSFEKIDDKTQMKLPSAYDKSIVVSQEQYNKARANYEKDPGKKLRQNIIIDDSGMVMHMEQPLSKNYIDKNTQIKRKKIEEENSNPILK